MARLNDNYLKLQAGYLFPEIGRRVGAFTEANSLNIGHPDASVPSRSRYRHFLDVP